MPSNSTERYRGLTDEQLRDMLQAKGYLADPGIPRAKIEEQLDKLESELVMGSKAVSQKATDYYYELYKNEDSDPRIKIRFTHQDGDREMSFCYDGGNGFVKNRHGVMKLPKWQFVNGEIYEVPYSVHEHINSLVVTDSKAVEGEDGFVRSQMYWRRRAISEPIVTKDQFLKPKQEHKPKLKQGA